MADLKIDKSRYTVDSLYQWDTNQELKIYGLSMVDPEIHFTNEAMGGSIVVDCTVDESGVISVKVPNSLLQYKYSIVAYIAGFEGDTFKTYHKVTIPVKARKRPGDYTLSLSDNEVYSFKSMSDRITNIEDEIQSEGSILYNYTLDADDVKLVEASGKKSIGEYIPLVSNSLKAVKGLSDKFKTMIDANTKLGETALSIAKGINSAKVFDTTADMEAWLSDEANKGKCDVGNNLYIIDVDVPDWWIAEVLDTPDSETGYYYKIAQLEVQKVDLTDINNDIDTLQEDVETLESDIEDIDSRVTTLENRGSGLPPRPVTTISSNTIVFTGLSNQLEVNWEIPTMYDVQIKGFNVYGYVGDEAPTDFQQFSFIAYTEETSISIEVADEYSYVLVASVSTEGNIQTDLIQMTTNTKTIVRAVGTTLETATWTEIDYISRYKKAEQYFSVGDTKSFTLNGVTYNAIICDFDHDDLEDGTKAGITFGLDRCYNTSAMYGSSSTSNNSHSWAELKIYTYLNDMLNNYCPSGLKKAMKKIIKKTAYSGQNTSLRDDICDVFLFSEVEVFGTANSSLSGEGYQYPIFTDNASRIRKDRNNSSALEWWLRSPKNGSTSYLAVATNGTLASNMAGNNDGVCFGFCI